MQTRRQRRHEAVKAALFDRMTRKRVPLSELLQAALEAPKLTADTTFATLLRIRPGEVRMLSGAPPRAPRTTGSKRGPRASASARHADKKAGARARIVFGPADATQSVLSMREAARAERQARLPTAASEPRTPRSSSSEGIPRTAHALAISDDVPAGTVVEQRADGTIRVKAPPSAAPDDTIGLRLEAGELVTLEDAAKALGLTGRGCGPLHHLIKNRRLTAVQGAAYRNGHRRVYIERASLERELRSRNELGPDEMTTTQAAELLDISRVAVNGLIRRGVLTARQIERLSGSLRGRFVLKRSEVEARAKAKKARRRKRAEASMLTSIEDDAEALNAIREHGAMSCAQIGEHYSCSEETIRLIVVGAVGKLASLADVLERWIEDGEPPEDVDLRQRIIEAYDLGGWPEHLLALHPRIDDVLYEVRSLPEALAESLATREAVRPEPATLEVGEVRSRLKGKVTSAHFATFAPIKRKLQVIPNHPRAREIQVCEPLAAKLTRGACATRWGQAQAEDFLEHLETCRGCAIGHANHEMLTSAPEEPLPALASERAA